MDNSIQDMKAFEAFLDEQDRLQAMENELECSCEECKLQGVG